MDSSRWGKVKKVFNTAYDLPEDERSSFLNQCDPDLRPEVERLLRAGDEAGGFINETAAVDLGLSDRENVDLYIGKQIDSYYIVREIGHGGMGTVYLANRSDPGFEKQFAIKLIKRGMDTNAVLKRFMMERQILAQLQHPNIANLVDGGTTIDGLPYFVMEYVEGSPVTKFCDEHELSTDERLGLFRKICSVIAYAHQNLVVHRDLKPSNIIVTDDGTPKLLDFGIAKLLHPDWSLDTHEATATMFRVMTPEYASPEQLRGQPITTASDVYSLGVVLYELLCGRRPIKVEGRLPDEAANVVLTEEPLKPSFVVSARSPIVKDTEHGSGRDTSAKTVIRNPKSLRGDLDNIILKALAKEPERRYQSVQEFSEDIRRHLEGLPVTATADSLSYRFAKFTKRHRTGVIAGGVIILTLLAATIVTSWQAMVARRERDRAEQRFNQVRKLANTVLFDYHDRIKEMPGATEVREKMVTDSLNYLDELAGEDDPSPDLQRELALAYQKVGDIQGDASADGNLGATGAAFDSYSKALAIQEKLVAADPANDEDRRLQARLMLNLAGQYESNGDQQSREKCAQEAVYIFSNLAEKQPNEKRSQSDLARGLWYLASAVLAKGDLDDSLQQYQRSADIFEKLAVENPDDRKFIRNAALTYKNIGGVYELKKDFPDALGAYKKALPIDAKNAAEDANSITSQLDLSFSYSSLCAVSMNLGDLKTSLENCDNALQIQKQVAGADPKNAFAARSLGNTLKYHGNTLMRMGYLDQAIADFRESAGLFEKLRAIAPDNAMQKASLAEVYSLLGDALSASSHYRLENSDPCPWFQKSISLWQEMESAGQLGINNAASIEELRQKIATCEMALTRSSK